jgi:hypothetical protein
VVSRRLYGDRSATGAGIGTTIGGSLLVPAARAGARALILSKFYQNAMTTPSYTAGPVTRGLAKLDPYGEYLNSPLARRFAEVAGPATYLEAR